MEKRTIKTLVQLQATGWSENEHGELENPAAAPMCIPPSAKKFLGKTYAMTTEIDEDGDLVIEKDPNQHVWPIQALVQ